MNRTETPIYDEVLNEACDHAIETGQDELLDDLGDMDKRTQPQTGATGSQEEL